MTEFKPGKKNTEDNPVQDPGIQDPEQGCVTNGGTPTLDASSPLIEERQPIDSGNDLGRRREELKLKHWDREKEIALKTLEFGLEVKRQQRKLDAISQLITSLTSLVILGAGIYFTALNKDFGPFMMGVGGTGGATASIQAVRRRENQDDEHDGSNGSS